ncbi:MEGF6-like protein [Mya arenaria]|uniref:MEGF6-like protein n=1 Tax=Mya arenaria TaxID=6604 RepID=A0ABY7G5H6_MYAAR|nr:MEGF6-like protein [Mya arenaria]
MCRCMQRPNILHFSEALTSYFVGVYNSITTLCSAQFRKDCSVSLYGDFCNATCPGGTQCFSNICERYTAKCVGCVSYAYGEYCELSCNNCVGGRCDQDTGNCLGECVRGHYGPKCDAQCHNRCTFCVQATGYCELCDTGTYGSACQYNCSTHCQPSSNGEITCGRFDGRCDSGRCETGFYQPTCTSSCGVNCRNFECDINSGNCSFGCTIGWFGRYCDGPCSINCVNENCLSRIDNCVEGCIPENYGPRCDIQCNPHCFSAICNDTGYCSVGCDGGYYGDMCELQCSETCTDGRCDRLTGNCAECSKIRPSPLCRSSACVVGFYGINCDILCKSLNCQDNVCDRYTGNCVGCVTGRYGDICSEECDTCLRGTTCQQADGSCDGACENGYFGSFCRQNCTSCITCNKDTGLCVQCPDGKYGQLCGLNCSSACVPVNGVVSCDISSAHCTSRQCVPGFWDLKCFSFCHPNCDTDANGNVTCDVMTGRCAGDCQAHNYGAQCDQRCESECYDDTCHRDSGVCAECLKPDPGFTCPNARYNYRLILFLLQRVTLFVTFTICLFVFLFDKSLIATCDEGKYGNDCNLDCSPGCTRVCDRYTAICSNCRAGLYGDECKQRCRDNCTIDCGQCTPSADGLVYCDIRTGACATDTCTPGYHGALCEFECGVNCKDSVSGINNCDRDTGICSDGCDIGYFGVYCTGDCSVTCLNRDCVGTATNCRQGCAFGYYGSDCLTSCPANCVGGGCDGVTGACDGSCKDEYFGAQCSQRCSSTCIDNRCDQSTGDCLECRIATANPSYFCRDAACDIGLLYVSACDIGLLYVSACDIGFFSQFCNNTCSTNCAGGCERYTARCAACVTGTYGATCNQSCGNCATNTCEQTSGFCIGPCRAGYYNNFCRATCLYSNCETCDKTSGVCSTCKQGFYGTNCEQSCSSNCYPDSNNLIYCSKDLGYCKANQCVPGYWDDTCSIQCEPTCLPDINNDRICEFQNGHCIMGCESTNYGDFCRLKCSNNCVSQLCERNGVCTLGCVAGKFGEICSMDCTQTCNDGTCDRSTGECAECNKPLNEQTPLCRSAGWLHHLVRIVHYFFTCRAKNNLFTKIFYLMNHNILVICCEIFVECNTGFAGLSCNISCPPNCRDKCERYESYTCAACLNGYYGATCDNSCGFCATGTCFKANGTCVGRCREGYYSDMCDLTCRQLNCRSCDRTSGECATCKQGHWGSDCSQDCSAECTSSSDGLVYCSKENGNCEIGACNPGFYSLTCQSECSRTCQKDPYGNRDCDFGTGICRDGCEDGYYGDYCDRQCHENCKGPICERDGECNRSLGCRDGFGWYGFDCTLNCTTTCTDNTCDRDDGVCDECRKLPQLQSPLCRSAGIIIHLTQTSITHFITYYLSKSFFEIILISLVVKFLNCVCKAVIPDLKNKFLANTENTYNCTDALSFNRMSA